MRGEKFGIPIFYFTELIGLAMGYGSKELGSNKHMVSAEPLLSQLQGGV
jgi:heterodisulfide reductase subunit B